MDGPAWLGIGAQRSGTTWFVDLLLQHPAVTLSSEGRKELHALYMPDIDLDAYRRLFSGCAGEWTPFYLRALWVPPVATKVLRGDAPVLVLLRDPVERFASAMRQEAARAKRELTELAEHHVDPKIAFRRRFRLRRSDAAWAGMYATQLEAWARGVGRDRMVVMQYERVVSDPQSAVDLVWRRLGLDGVPLRDTERRSRTSTQETWEWPEGLRDALRAAYQPEVARLAAEWDIDPALWPSL